MSRKPMNHYMRLMSLDLSRVVERLDPLTFDDSSSLLGGNSKMYFSNVGETIQEEEDEEVTKPPLQAEMQNKLKLSHDKVNSLKYLQLGATKTKKIRSICLESEPILEELEEQYEQQDVDQFNHTFKIYSRERLGSIDECNN